MYALTSKVRGQHSDPLEVVVTVEDAAKKLMNTVEDYVEIAVINTTLILNADIKATKNDSYLITKIPSETHFEIPKSAVKTVDILFDKADTSDEDFSAAHDLMRFEYKCFHNLFFLFVFCMND